MGQKVPPGLIRRGKIYHIQKKICGRRIRESTGTSDLKEAEQYMMHRAEEVRQSRIYGVRPERIFREAATKFLNESDKPSLAKDAWALKRIDPFIGKLVLEQIHMTSLAPYIEFGKRQGWKNRTINMPLEVVRHILNLAAGEWIDENGLTWLARAPKIRLLSLSDQREPFPLNWAEQGRLLAALPSHLRPPVIFALNTGLRNGEICGLEWDYEIRVPELGTSVFVIPKQQVKNREDRLVVINTDARSVIEGQRGLHDSHVFHYGGRPLQTLLTTAWKEARCKADLPKLRVHDLRHTFGARLRAAGVNFEDRQDLLGHKNGRITTHYSAPMLVNLMEAAERVCLHNRHKFDTGVILRKKIPLRLVANELG